MAHTESRFTKDLCFNFVGREEILEQLQDLFGRWTRAHGAIYLRIVLWGLTGNGKRQIAIKFAHQIHHAEKGARKILWIEGSRADTFIRDMINAYRELTDCKPPQGLITPWLLAKIQATLESRCNEWLMIVLDLDPSLENHDSNDACLRLIEFLPNRGQVLLTTSVTKIVKNELTEIQELSCGTNFSYARAIFVDALPLSDTVAYLRSTNSLHKGDQFSLSCLERLTSHTISLSISCANASMLGVSLSKYVQRLDLDKIDPDLDSYGHRDLRKMVLEFSQVMKSTCTIIRAKSPQAWYLMRAISLLDHADIPVRLLSQLAIFDESIGELYDCLDYLVQSKLIQVHDRKVGGETVSVHCFVHRWAHNKHREELSQPEERETILSEWMTIFDLELSPMDSPEYVEQEYWSLLPHVITLLTHVSRVNARGRRAMSLFYKTGSFLNDHQILPLSADTFTLKAVAQGQYLQMKPYTDDATRAENDLKIAGAALKRAQALCAVLRYRAADQELQLAKNSLLRLKSAPEAIKILAQVRDQEVLQLIEQMRYSEAKVLLISLLDDDIIDVEPKRQATWHHWMARCYRASAEDVLALKHSTMALLYIVPMQKDWGMQSNEYLCWIERHASILFSLDKYEASLIFWIKVFDMALESFVPNHYNTWRFLYFIVKSYCAIDELDEAERYACMMLRLCHIEDLVSTTLAFALIMLQAIGREYRLRGRLLEAEWLFRFCLKMVEENHPPNVDGRGDFECYGLQYELIMTLLAQEKVENAQMIRDQNRQMYEDCFPHDNWVEIGRDTYKVLQECYERGLDARRAALNGEYSFDQDWMIGRGAAQSWKDAERTFGNPDQRILEGVDDLKYDLDLNGSKSARYSRLLDLIDYNFNVPPAIVRVKLIQTNLTDYWQWCMCIKHRKRSDSIDTLTLSHKKIIREDEIEDNAQISAKEKRQTSIKDYFLRIPKPFPEECHEKCPCRIANSKAQIETAAAEANLYRYKQPSKSSKTGMLYHIQDMKRSTNVPWIWEHECYEVHVIDEKSPTPEGESDIDLVVSHLEWMHSYFRHGDWMCDNENYLPFGLDVFKIPTIIMTPPDGCPIIHKNWPRTAMKRKDKTKGIRHYFKVDWISKFVPDHSASSASSVSGSDDDSGSERRVRPQHNRSSRLKRRKLYLAEGEANGEHDDENTSERDTSARNAETGSRSLDDEIDRSQTIDSDSKSGPGSKQY